MRNHFSNKRRAKKTAVRNTGTLGFPTPLQHLEDIIRRGSDRMDAHVLRRAPIVRHLRKSRTLSRVASR